MEDSDIEKRVIENFSGALATILLGPVPDSVVSSVYSLYGKVKQEFAESYRTIHRIFSGSLY